jgi:formylglycine-generating enzyme
MRRELARIVVVAVAVALTASCSRPKGTGGTAGGTDNSRDETARSGTDSVTSDRGDGGCTPGAQRCVGTGVIETCAATREWSPEWHCATGACADGACTGSTTTGTSCEASGKGLTNCGPNKESCCTSLEVPGGTYYRTYANYDDGGVILVADAGRASLANPATVSNFRLDKYVVTVGRFRQFVKAWNKVEGGPGWLPAEGSGKHTHLNGGRGLVNVGTDGGVAHERGWLSSDDSKIDATDSALTLICDPFDPYATWTTRAANHETLPINCVNWWEAYAFCIWDGGFLPSASEREYAAVGGRQQRKYPWGAEPPETLRTSAPGNSFASPYANFAYGMPPAPVGMATMGAGLWGQMDLVGEVLEWSLEWDAPMVSPCIDCAYLSVGPSRAYVVEGGFSYGKGGALIPPQHQARNPPTRDFETGFRCARTP